GFFASAAGFCSASAAGFSSLGGSFFPAACAAVCWLCFADALALPAALAVACSEDCAAPAFFCAPAVSPWAALSTAFCAFSAVSAAFFAAFSNSAMAPSTASFTFSSPGTLQADLALPFASAPLFFADSAAPVALCAAADAAWIASA